MAYNNLQHNYLESEVLSASPTKLVALLYRGAYEAILAGRECLSAGDIAGRSRKINKATNILSELTRALDPSKGAEISASLAHLYDYMIRRLNEANFNQQDEPLVEVAKLLGTLLPAWEEIGPVSSVESGKSDGPAPHQDEYQPLSCSF